MLVSVIIPCFNVEPFVAECIESVLNQTYPDIEIICVDDGSEDGTLNVLEKFSNKIDLIIPENHKGAGAARNTGLAHARGDYIQFLDADDLLFPEKIASNIQLVKGAPSRNAVVIGKHLHRRPNGRVEQFGYLDEQWLSIVSFVWGNTCCNLWPREILQKVGGFDENLTSFQDCDLGFRVACVNPDVVYDPNYYTLIRERPDSITTSVISPEKDEERLLTSIRLREKMKAYLTEKGLFQEEYQQAIYEGLFTHIKYFAHRNTEKAIRYYRSHIPREFRPQNRDVSAFYRLNFRLFGFAGAERIARLVNRLKGRL